jgi:hypothetical protein
VRCVCKPALRDIQAAVQQLSEAEKYDLTKWLLHQIPVCDVEEQLNDAILAQKFRIPTHKEPTHEHLWLLVQKLPTDFDPWGQRDRDTDWGPDCSSGCKHFHCLKGKLGYDWGICTNAKSPRSGLLTFEHMGCKAFESEDEQEATDSSKPVG